MGVSGSESVCFGADYLEECDTGGDGVVSGVQVFGVVSVDCVDLHETVAEFGHCGDDGVRVDRELDFDGEFVNRGANGAYGGVSVFGHVVSLPYGTASR